MEEKKKKEKFDNLMTQASLCSSLSECLDLIDEACRALDTHSTLCVRKSELDEIKDEYCDKRPDR